jgi:hypothetical protein
MSELNVKWRTEQGQLHPMAFNLDNQYQMSSKPMNNFEDQTCGLTDRYDLPITHSRYVLNTKNASRGRTKETRVKKTVMDFS